MDSPGVKAPARSNAWSFDHAMYRGQVGPGYFKATSVFLIVVHADWIFRVVPAASSLWPQA